MIQSMTGFGQADINRKDISIHIEIKSLNNRYTDINVRLPRRFTQYEEELREVARKTLIRGKIDIFVTIDEKNSTLQTLKINRGGVKQYLNVLRDLQRNIGHSEEINLEHLLFLDDIFQVEEKAEIKERYWKFVKTGVEQAIRDVQKSRRKEGRALETDLRKRVKSLKRALLKVESISAKRSEEVYQKLRQRIATLLQDEERISAERLEMEIAIIADKADISEECTRLQNHIENFFETLKKGDESGKRLDFIIQEMNRETNTIGSKGNNYFISHLVVQMKEEIERMREQVRNVM